MKLTSSTKRRRTITGTERERVRSLRRRMTLESLERREMLNGDPVDLETGDIVGCGSADQLLTQIAGEVADDGMEESMPEDTMPEESGSGSGSGSGSASGSGSEGMEEGGDGSGTPELSEFDQRRKDALETRDAAIASVGSGSSLTGTPPDEAEADERDDLKDAIEGAVAACGTAVDGPRDNLLALMASEEAARDATIATANATKTDTSR